MDANKALQDILSTAKALTTTEHSRAMLVQDCDRSGIKVDHNLKLSSPVNENHIDVLLKNLTNPVLRILVRRVLRKYW